MTTCVADSSQGPQGAAPPAPWPWLLAVLLLGGALRLVWQETIEYKLDEAWLFRLVANHVNEGKWAPLGMPSSQRVRIPGLSVWVFYPLGHLFGVDEPTALTRGVSLCNLSALLLLVLFAWRRVPAAEREAWYWAALLLAVNPIDTVYHRKLWPPCMLPMFCTLFLVAWWHRDRRRGALAWGVLGTCLGQIHVSGFLFAAALVGTTALAGTRRVRWGWWLTGGVAGSVAMVPWFVYLAGDRAPVHHNCFAFHRWIEGKFWGHWATEPLGLDLRGIVGEDHAALLRWPLLDGHPTYGVAGLQVLAAVLGATILAVALLRWWRRDRLAAAAPLSETALLVRAGFLGYGLLLTLAAVRFYRHYMLVTFPLSGVWLARLALPEAARRGKAFGRSLLLGLCVVGALVSAVTLSFLHERGGTRVGPFGRTYQQQVRETGQRPPPVDVPEE